MPPFVFGEQPDGVRGAAAGAVVESGGAGAGMTSSADVIARVASRGFMFIGLRSFGWPPERGIST